MSEEKKVEVLADEALEEVSGGVTRNMRAALACIRGDYGNGQDRVARLTRAGYDYEVVQGLVNDYLKYGDVARDVINGKYGNGSARVAALKAAGYDAQLVQDIVNGLLA